jgi:hypothetical protein
VNKEHTLPANRMGAINEAVCAREDDPRISPADRARLEAAEPLPKSFDPKTGTHTVEVSLEYLETYGLVRHEDPDRPCPTGVTPPANAQRPKQRPVTIVNMLSGMLMKIQTPPTPPKQAT